MLLVPDLLRGAVVEVLERDLLWRCFETCATCALFVKVQQHMRVYSEAGAVSGLKTCLLHKAVTSHCCVPRPCVIDTMPVVQTELWHCYKSRQCLGRCNRVYCGQVVTGICLHQSWPFHLLPMPGASSALQTCASCI